jgi:ABC-type transport system involved in multi-copper enzyme maturation permease subunit
VIDVMLRDLRPRLVLLALLCLLLYFLEPAFHQHGEVDPQFAADAGPLGVSATLAYLSALAMILLLAGFVSRDFREGYAAIQFSHPTSPLAFYGLRWALALGVTLATALLFLLVGQSVAWGEVRGGGSGLLLALLAALVYGGLTAFFSAVLRGGEGWVVFVLFLPTPLPPILTWLENTLPASVHALVLFLLPPQHALQEVYRGLLLGQMNWPAVGFAAGYGVFWLLMAGLALRLRLRR